MLTKTILKYLSKPITIPKKQLKVLKFFGRVGFVSKGLVYGIIGGLTCATALDANTPRDVSDDASPQSAFILLGGTENIGTVLLILMAIGLCFYSIWRFWEGITLQGYNKNYSASSNFFKYRLSPLASGFVYIFYLVYIIKVLRYIRSLDNNHNNTNKNDHLNPGCIPNCLNEHIYGKILTGLIGVAFLIAFVTQIIPGLFGTFIKELKTHKYPKILKYTINIIGNIGFIGRGIVFLLVAIFMFKSLASNQDVSKNTVGASLDQLKQNKHTRRVMFILGLFLVDFALFATMNVFCKYFPTRQSETERESSSNRNDILKRLDNLDP